MGSLKSSCTKVGIRALMFLIYLFMGAGMFIGIERKTQDALIHETKQKMDELKDDLKRRRNLTEQEFSAIQQIIEESLDVGVIGSRLFLKTWDFANAFFFCGNVITTIGYGHITPRTVAGRIVVMLYALFGIPLTGFFLRTVGNEMTTLIAYIIKYYDRRVMNRESDKLEIKCAVVSMILALFMLVFGSGVFHVSETWEYYDAFYFCFVTLTTIGFGDMVPGQSRDSLGHAEKIFIEVASLIYYVIGLSIMSGVIVSISGVIEEKTKKLDITDPMDAIRTLRLENLNSKAMKKLGYKVDEGMRFPPTGNGAVNGGVPGTTALSNQLLRRNSNVINHSSVNQNRRGTLIPDDTRIFNNLPKTKPRNGSILSATKETKVDVDSILSLKGTPQMKKKDFTLNNTNKIHSEDNISTTKLITPNDNNNVASTNKNNVIHNRNVAKPDNNDNTNNNVNNNNNIISKENNKDLINAGNFDESISNSADGNKRLDKVSNYARRIIDIQEDPGSSQEELLSDINEDRDDSLYKEQVTNRAANQVNGNETHNNYTKPIPKKFVLKGNNSRVVHTPNELEVKAHSTTNLKSGIHRKISRERTKNKKKILKHSASLKDLQIYYSSNLHNHQKEKKSNCQGNETKRVGLPAELFANDVSFRRRSDACQESLATDTNSFYSIQMNSPIGAYSNPYFQSDDSIPTATNSLELPTRSDQNIEIKRPKTAERN